MPEIDLSKVKDAGVPIGIVVGKHDRLATVNDAHRLLATLNGYLGKFPVIHFEEKDGGLESFMVGKDMSYFKNGVMEKIRLHNPLPKKVDIMDIFNTARFEVA